MAKGDFNAVRVLKRVLIYTALVLAAVLFMIPLVVLVMTSIKGPREIVNIFALPETMYWQNYVSAFERMGRGIWNSVCITVPAVVISTLVGAFGAYPLAQFRFRGDSTIFMVLLAGLFIPSQIVLIPLFQIIRALGVYDSYVGMWIVHTAYGIPICTFYLRNFFATIPRSLMEAALLDGCSVAGYFFKILLRLGKPGLAAVFILQARAIWNDLLYGNTLTRSDAVRPMTVELATFVSQTDVQYGQLMAATVISILPMIVMFFVFRREFISGMLGGAVKN